MRKLASTRLAGPSSFLTILLFSQAQQAGENVEFLTVLLGWLLFLNFLQRGQEPAATRLAEGSICPQRGYCALVDFSIRVMRTRLPTENTFLTDGKVVCCLVALGPLTAAN